MKVIYSRKSNRLSSWNYSENGKYFITICTKNRSCILGNGIVGDGVLDVPAVKLTKYGDICIKQIEKMNTVYSEISAEKYIVMPNHIHLILTIENRKGTSRTPSPTNELVPFYVSTFKRMVGKKIGENIWERSYYDHIIRDEKDYEKIWQYIDSNAAKWEKDCFYRE